MIRYIKPARDKDFQRGFFSYLKESVVNIYNAEKNNPNQNLKIFFDLKEIPGYGVKNLYDICYNQDYADYSENREKYLNIEREKWNIDVRTYDYNLFNKEMRIDCELIIKKFYQLNETMENKIKERHLGIDFSKTIGFHRRATDMESVHGFKSLTLNQIFSKIETEEFENIFLMSDNLEDLKKMRNRYGSRLITYDEFSCSSNEYNPFFKNNISDETSIENHIQEIVFGSLTLGKTKKLICTLSNLTGFSILSNAELNFEIL